VRARWKSGIAAVIVGCVVSALAVAARRALYDFVRQEASAQLERRTGLRCSIERVDVDPFRLALHGVALRDVSDTFHVRMDDIVVDVNVAALAFGGKGAVRSIAVRGGAIRADGTREALASVLSFFAGRLGAWEERRGFRATRALGPRVVFEGLRAEIWDELGAFAIVAGFDLRLDGDRLELTARDVSLAPGAFESVGVGGLRLEATLADRRIARIEASEVRIDLTDSSRVVAAGIWTRVRAVLSRMLDAPTRLDRSAFDGGIGWLRWIAPAFAAHIRDLRIVRTSGGSAHDVVAGLDVAFERTGLDRLRTRGRGTPGRGGKLAWDLTLEPLAFRGEGSVELEDVAVAAFEPLLPAGLPLHEPELARIGGELWIDGRRDAIRVVGQIRVHDLALQSPAIAPFPIRGIGLVLDGEATYRFEARRFDIVRLRVTPGPASARLAGAIEWTTDHYLIELDAELPPTRCNDAIAAIPSDLLQEVSGFAMSGTIGGRISTRIDSRDLDATRLTIRFVDGCRFQSVPPIADLARFEQPFVHRVEEPDGSIFEMETGPGTEGWTPIGEISPFLLHAVLAHEDAGFFSHSGFSVGSIREALVRNLRAGRYVMGASTISMQLVKNIFLRREKTLARKIQEVLLTWWIESVMSKERILELYLNVIEFGPGVYGIRQASRHYFGVEPAELSPAQAAYLATILPNPKAYHAHWESGSLPRSWAHHTARFLRLLGERGRYDATAVEEGLRELEQLRFYRPGDPPPEPRRFRGRTRPLPLSGEPDRIDSEWDEAPGGDVTALGAIDTE
jgi:monofunctional biosynthetic peptidoglycan transglycosylase